MLEKFCLGTVQFGLKYGINNKIGKPAESDVFRIMDCAIEEGIRTFDTARAYGDSEVVLGKWIAGTKFPRNELTIISKFMPKSLRIEQNLAHLTLQEHVYQSLERLQIEYLDGFLLHTPEEFYVSDIMDQLLAVKEQGLVRSIGVSIYELEDAIRVVSSGLVQAIQVPYNILDQRVDRSDFFKLAEENGVTVFARSPFLQGLLTMKLSKIPDHLQGVKTYIQELNKISEEYDISIIEMCMLFSLFNKNIHYVVFGVDSIGQLKEDLSVLKKTELGETIKNLLQKKFINIEKSIIFPSLWAKK